MTVGSHTQVRNFENGTVNSYLYFTFYRPEDLCVVFIQLHRPSNKQPESKLYLPETLCVKA